MNNSVPKTTYNLVCNKLMDAENEINRTKLIIAKLAILLVGAVKHYDNKLYVDDADDYADREIFVSYEGDQMYVTTEDGNQIAIN